MEIPSAPVDIIQEIHLEPSEMARILREEYSLSELEECLNITPEDLDEGYLYFVEEHYDEVLTLLREDLFF